MFVTNQSVWFTNNMGNQSVSDSYDAVGNLTKRVWKSVGGATNHVQTLDWDFKGRLNHVQDIDEQGNAVDWNAVYDGFDRRIYSYWQSFGTNTSGGSTIVQYYDPQVEFLELGVINNGLATWRVYGPDMSGCYGGMQGIGGLDAIVEEPNIFEPVLGDARGNLQGYYSPIQVKPVWNSSRPTGYGGVPGYRPVSLDEGVNLVQASAWQGSWSDLTGFYWRGKRYYDPVAGRWVSADSVWNGRDPNYFTFCGSDPINSFDPDGRFGKEWVAVANTLRDSEDISDRFSAMPAGFVGAIAMGVGSTPSVYDQAAQRMAEARAEINTYSGRDAFLARTLMLSGDFAFGTTKLVNDPFNTLLDTPQGFVNFGAKIGGDVYNVGANPSVNTFFNIVEDTLAVAGMADGAVGLNRAADALIGNPNPKVFWSGGRSLAGRDAEAYAKAVGGQTLEMTGTGMVLDAITTKWTYPLLRPLWEKASFDFAASAEGPVDVFQSATRGVRVDSVWRRVEYPQLMKQGNQINYHLAP
jgi:RHS repeat-associated protein